MATNNALQKQLKSFHRAQEATQELAAQILRDRAAAPPAPPAAQSSSQATPATAGTTPAVPPSNSSAAAAPSKAGAAAGPPVNPTRDAINAAVKGSAKYSWQTAEVEVAGQNAVGMLGQRSRKTPRGAKVKTILRLLFEERRPMTPEEIEQQVDFDVARDTKLLEILKGNIKVHYADGVFAYKSKFEIASKEMLLRTIRSAAEGLSCNELKDSYPDILKDCEALREAGDAWIIQNSETQEDIIYPNDPRVVIQCDEDVKELVRSIDVPPPQDFHTVERELQKAGIKPLTNMEARLKASTSLRMQLQKEKEEKRRKRSHQSRQTKYTNAHLLELFQGTGTA